LFLDEIAEVPLPMQAKLLRVLQEQELERVGDTRTRKIDVRIIAATNRYLKAEVDARRFGEDLFYRLSVFPIQAPPLRERRADIPLLAAHFVKQSARRMNRLAPKFTPVTISQLTSYDWPGNVRELQMPLSALSSSHEKVRCRFDLGDSPIGAPRPTPQVLAKSALRTRDELKREERDNIATALKSRWQSVRSWRSRGIIGHEADNPCFTN
jgi:transcriptional regulator with GAF, ATPase, and Fis domain